MLTAPDGDAAFTVPNYSDFSRGSRNDDDSDEADEAVECADREDADEDYVDIASEVPEDGIAAIVKCEYGHAQRQDGFSDKEVKSQKSSRRTSKVNEQRVGAPSTIRKATRPHLTSMQHPFPGFHPPMALPEWDSFPNSPSVMRHDPLGGGGQQNISPHSMHDAFSQVQWNAHVQPGQEMGHQFNEYCMISPPQEQNSVPQGPYVDGAFPIGSQHHFAGVPHASQFDQAEIIHDHRHAQMRGATPYEAFMMQPGPSHEMMQRAYF